MSAKAVPGTHRLKIRTSRRTELKNVTEEIEEDCKRIGLRQRRLPLVRSAHDGRRDGE
jgi:thiamine phosphate synthase YjbQ (UPF0047 family)